MACCGLAALGGGSRFAILRPKENLLRGGGEFLQRTPGFTQIAGGNVNYSYSMKELQGNPVKRLQPELQAYGHLG